MRGVHCGGDFGMSELPTTEHPALSAKYRRLHTLARERDALKLRLQQIEAESNALSDECDELEMQKDD